MTRTIGSIGAFAIAAGACVGWGYWQASRRADVYVRLNDVGLKTESQLYGPVTSAGVAFRDATRRVVASGRADEGIVRMTHPTAGDCRPEERAGGGAWRTCFDAHSRWLLTWVREVRDMRIQLDGCTIDDVPVDIDESKGAWWLWWLPLPHTDSSTSTHFTLTAWIDSARCRPAPPV